MGQRTTRAIMATQQTSAPDTLPADYFSNTSASTTLPANFFSQDAAPPTLPASFFSNQAAQPAHDPSARFALHGPASIGPAQEPSIWQRIKSAVTEGIPNYSSRTVYNPRYGETQLITPEAALTPEEQRAHPIVTGAGELAGNLT